MRKIKFRCWDTKNKQMQNFDWICSQDFVPGDPQVGGLIWMQFTGLLDKQGKEIYEGDIVKWDSCGDDKKATVKWAKNETYFYPFGHGNSCDCCYRGPDMPYNKFIVNGKGYERKHVKCEIIGNKYEKKSSKDSKK